MVVSPRIRAIVALAAICLGVGIFAAVGLGGSPRQAHADATATAGDTVTVDGTGTVQGVPDRLVATFGVQVTRSSVRDALDGVAGNGKRLISALHHAGVADKYIRTTDLELSPHYDNSGRRNGYDASETIAATFTDLGSAGRGISDTAAAAGNAATIQGLAFDLSGDSKLLASARDAAYADAKARAQQYAQLSGRSLGSVRHVTETVRTSDPTQPSYKGAFALAGGASAPDAVAVRAGQTPVTVVVTIVWQLS